MTLAIIQRITCAGCQTVEERHIELQQFSTRDDAINALLQIPKTWRSVLLSGDACHDHLCPSCWQKATGQYTAVDEMPRECSDYAIELKMKADEERLKEAALKQVLMQYEQDRAVAKAGRYEHLCIRCHNSCKERGHLVRECQRYVEPALWKSMK